MGNDFIGFILSLKSDHSLLLQSFGVAKLVNVNPFTEDLDNISNKNLAFPASKVLSITVKVTERIDEL